MAKEKKAADAKLSWGQKSLKSLKRRRRYSLFLKSLRREVIL
jgi:hypothetical protein